MIYDSKLRFLACIMIGSGAMQAVSQNSDMRVGNGARTAGMAGAGLALPFDVDQRGHLNPALFAFAKPGFRFVMPSFGIHLKNMSVSKLRDNLNSVGSGGVDPNNLGNFARDFGTQSTEFGANADFGVSVAQFNLSVGGEALVNAVPNASLRVWADAGADPNNVPADARMDGYGYGFYSIDASYGARACMPDGKRPGIALGVRARSVTAYYSHHIADQGDIENGGLGGSSPANEMGGSDVLSNRGLGFDVGAQLTGGEQQNLFFGAVIRNAVEPRISFARTLPDLGVSQAYNPFKRQFDLGIGTKTQGNTYFALDLTDATNAVHTRTVRFGVEQVLAKGFAVRAGLTQPGGLTVGVSLFQGSGFGLDLAVGKELPLTLLSAIRF